MPSISVKQILIGIQVGFSTCILQPQFPSSSSSSRQRRVLTIFSSLQDLLTDPNPKSPAQDSAYTDFQQRPIQYEMKVKKQADGGQAALSWAKLG